MWHPTAGDLFMTDFFRWCSILQVCLVGIWILTSFLEMRWHSVDGHLGSFSFLAFTNGSSEGCFCERLCMSFVWKRRYCGEFDTWCVCVCVLTLTCAHGMKARCQVSFLIMAHLICLLSRWESHCATITGLELAI